jgi:hypothetical protein
MANTNMTQAALNSTIANFTRSSNNTFNQFVASIPAALRNNALFQTDLQNVQQMMAQLNMSLQSFQDQLIPAFDSVRMQIASSQQQYYSQIIQPSEMFRSQIFSNYMMNASTINCSIVMNNATMAVFKANGGPNSFFNCSTNEAGLLPKIQPFLASFLTTFQQDINATYADMATCFAVKNLTMDPTSTSPMPFSVQQCLQSNSMILMQLSSYVSQFSSNINSLIMGMLSNAQMRAMTCGQTTATYIQSLFYPVSMNYTTCINTIMGNV